MSRGPRRIQTDAPASTTLELRLELLRRPRVSAVGAIDEVHVVAVVPVYHARHQRRLGCLDAEARVPRRALRREALSQPDERLGGRVEHHAQRVVPSQGRRLVLLRERAFSSEPFLETRSGSVVYGAPNSWKTTTRTAVPGCTAARETR